MKKLTIATLLLFSTALVSGCVSDEQAQPTLATELGATEQLTEQYSVNTAWWQTYNNEELNKLVDLALANNPDYLKAAIQVNKEFFRLNIAQADLFPTLMGDLGASSRKKLNKGSDSTNSFSGELGVRYEVDLYGKIRDAETAQQFEYEATSLDKEAARLALINSVTDLYFNLEYLSNAIDLTHRNIKAYNNIHNIMKNRYSSGKVDKLEVVQAEQSLVSERNSLLQYETQFKEMEQSLKNIAGIKPTDKWDLKFGDLLDQKTPGVQLDIPTAVLANRPDLKASEFRLKKSFKDLTAMEKNWYPSVALNGAFGSSSNKSRTTFDFPFLMGGVAIDLPFLDWTRVKNNVKISEADYQITLVDFKDTLTQALNEIAYYHYAYEKSNEIFKNTRQNVGSNTKIKEYYEIRYNNGKAEFKDLLEAIHRLNTSKRNLVQQKYQIIKYENYIYKAMGGQYTARNTQSTGTKPPAKNNQAFNPSVP